MADTLGPNMEQQKFDRVVEYGSESNTPPNEKVEATHLDNIRTISRVPGNDNYYEKDGLRTYGDGEDHDHVQPMTFKKFMALVAMAFLWTGSQIPVYLFGESQLYDSYKYVVY